LNINKPVGCVHHALYYDMIMNHKPRMILTIWGPSLSSRSGVSWRAIIIFCFCIYFELFKKLWF